MITSLTALLLGIVVGMRHAPEPDHFAAVSVLLADAPRPTRGALLGALWGAGHTAALLVVALALAAASMALPRALSDLFELGVALMLILLGTRSLYRAIREGRMGPSVGHAHGHVRHRHSGPPAHLHIGPSILASRPALIGIVHGLAGSGALTALAASKIESLLGRLTFIALFGVGSVLGMTALSVLAGWSAARLLRSGSAARLVVASTGALSVAVGGALGWPLVASRL